MGDKNFLRAFVSREESGGQAGEPIRFTASSTGVKRDGIDLDMEGWILDNYRKNPVFLWAHDYWGKNLPLGRVDVSIEGDKLMADVLFDQNDDFAKAVERKYRDGFLHTVSVGWNFVQDGKKRKMDLLDVSGVPVPGDPDALMERQYEALKRMFEAKGDETGDGGRKTGKEDPKDRYDAEVRGEQEPVWETIAAEMVEIFLSPGDESDELRERRYRALLPKYRRLGKVAPEFLTVEELSALDEKEIRGLFLENEADSRTPKGSDKVTVESPEEKGERQKAKEFRAEVEQAVSLLQGVLSRMDGATNKEIVEDEDGESVEALMMRAMEEKLKLQMRSLK